MFNQRVGGFCLPPGKKGKIKQNKSIITGNRTPVKVEDIGRGRIEALFLRFSKDWESSMRWI